jgi:hypothetical protein
MAQIKRKHASNKHLARLIEEEVGYFNGWLVSEASVQKACELAATRILRYLGRKAGRKCRTK